MRAKAPTIVILLLTVTGIRFLRFYTLNARSILPKLDELKIITENSNPDVVCIRETWLSQEISDGEMSIPGLFCSEGQKSPGWWGVGIR